MTLIKNTADDYGIVEKVLHWSLALLVLAMLAGGFFMDKIPKPLKHSIVNLHKLLGLLILILAVIFLIWKFLNTKPPYPSDMPPWQKFLAHFVQHMLMLMVVVMPLAGWTMATAARKAPHLGSLVINLPGIPESKALSGICWNIHATVAWILIGLISLHILGALKHLLINKDNVFKRMWF